jgi:CRISPR system Cascade subunit CasB
MTQADESIRKIVRAWWKRLMSSSDGSKRAARAELRRCTTPLDALAIHDTLDLYRQLRAVHGWVKPDRVAILAVVLAQLKEASQEPIAKALGRKIFGDKDSAVMSEARFRRLLQADDDELLDQFRRAIRLLKNEANPESIALTILNWGDETRRRFIFDYYRVFPDTPAVPADAIL